MESKFGEPGFVLPPKHALVFSVALRYLSDVIGWEDGEDADWESGISVFDQLRQGQKQVTLLEVARALLQRGAKPSKVCAYVAAAVAAVYETLFDLIEIDIETDPRQTTLRGQVLAALDEMDYWDTVNEGLVPEEAPAQRPSKACADRHVWGDLVEALRTAVLEDYDFDLEPSFLDVDPQAGAARKRLLNIEPNYFTDIPEDPPRTRLPAVRQELHELAGEGGADR